MTSKQQSVGLPSFKDQVHHANAPTMSDPSLLPISHNRGVPLVEAQAVSATRLQQEHWPPAQSVDLHDDPVQKRADTKDVFTIKRSTVCWATALLLAVLLTAGTVVGVFCGTGHCSTSSSTNASTTETGNEQTSRTPSTLRPSLAPANYPNTVAPSAAPVAAAPTSSNIDRATGITNLINQRTLSSIQLEYPSPPDRQPTPEEQALVNIIEFSTWLDETRDEVEVMQRFALMSIWYSNGVAAWNAGNHWNSQVCQWPAVECSTDGRVSSLALWNNQLRNELPADIGLLTSLTTLGLGENDLTGTIPTTLGKCTLLQRLALDQNKIGSTIPTELSQLTALTSLNMAVNMLQGSLPSSLSALSKLAEFHIDNNDAIAGNIPSELANWTSLRKGFIFNTNLRGVMPLCGSTTSPSQLEELVADCDDVACSCCTACCSASSDSDIPTWVSEAWPCI